MSARPNARSARLHDSLSDALLAQRALERARAEVALRGGAELRDGRQRGIDDGVRDDELVEER